MRLYAISILSGRPAAFAGTMADARAKRQELVETKEDVKKKDVEISEIEVLTNKTGLLAFLNDLVAEA